MATRVLQVSTQVWVPVLCGYSISDKNNNAEDIMLSEKSSTKNDK